MYQKSERKKYITIIIASLIIIFSIIISRFSFKINNRTIIKNKEINSGEAAEAKFEINVEQYGTSIFEKSYAIDDEESFNQSSENLEEQEEPIEIEDSDINQDESYIESENDEAQKSEDTDYQAEENINEFDENETSAVDQYSLESYDESSQNDLEEYNDEEFYNGGENEETQDSFEDYSLDEENLNNSQVDSLTEIGADQYSTLTVHYYQMYKAGSTLPDGTVASADTLTTNSVQPDVVFKDVVVGATYNWNNIKTNIVGYTFDHSTPESIVISADASQNVMYMYYYAGGPGNEDPDDLIKDPVADTATVTVYYYDENDDTNILRKTSKVVDSKTYKMREDAKKISSETAIFKGDDDNIYRTLGYFTNYVQFSGEDGREPRIQIDILMKCREYYTIASYYKDKDTLDELSYIDANGNTIFYKDTETNKLDVVLTDGNTNIYYDGFKGKGRLFYDKTQIVLPEDYDINNYQIPEIDVIDGYKLDTTGAGVRENLGGEGAYDVEITYYFTKEVNLIIHYVDSETNSEIGTQTVTVLSGDDYNVNDYIKEIDGYELAEKPATETGKAGRSDIDITLKYKKKGNPNTNNTANNNNVNNNNNTNNNSNNNQNQAPWMNNQNRNNNNNNNQNNNRNNNNNQNRNNNNSNNNQNRNNNNNNNQAPWMNNQNRNNNNNQNNNRNNNNNNGQNRNNNNNQNNNRNNNNNNGQNRNNNNQNNNRNNNNNNGQNRNNNNNQNNNRNNNNNNGQNRNNNNQNNNRNNNNNNGQNRNNNNNQNNNRNNNNNQNRNNNNNQNNNRNNNNNNGQNRNNNNQNRPNNNRNNNNNGQNRNNGNGQRPNTNNRNNNNGRNRNNANGQRANVNNRNTPYRPNNNNGNNQNNMYDYFDQDDNYDDYNDQNDGNGSNNGNGGSGRNNGNAGDYDYDSSYDDGDRNDGNGGVSGQTRDSNQSQTDNTKANGKLPYTGFRIVLIPIILLSGLGIAFYIKYKKY